jgi:hypothetical protein
MRQLGDSWGFLALDLAEQELAGRDQGHRPGVQTRSTTQRHARPAMEPTHTAA